jgi:flagellar motor component MotA
MATCPRCFGALTDDHKCPRGVFSRFTATLPAIGVGAVLGTVICFAIEDRPAAAVVVAAAALGGVLASAVRQAVSGSSF